jgi:hypothetical protein
MFTLHLLFGVIVRTGLKLVLAYLGDSGPQKQEITMNLKNNFFYNLYDCQFQEILTSPSTPFLS